jgi:2-phospho-L-lactate guanylyltransferase
MRAKSKLSDVLSRGERETLHRQLLEQTLITISEVPQVERTLVISRDPSALALARDFGARTVSERGNPNLRSSLVRSSLVARGYGVSAVLILPADLPLLSKEDIERFLDHAEPPPVVVIAPDRRGQGTNALLSSPPGLIEYNFGPNTFSLNIAQAEKAQARVEICDFPSLGLDLDLPEDLEFFGEKRLEGLLKPDKE